MAMEAWLLLIYSALNVFWFSVDIDPMPLCMTLLAILTFYWVLKRA
jgi:hypothetical protein